MQKDHKDLKSLYGNKCKGLHFILVENGNFLRDLRILYLGCGWGREGGFREKDPVDEQGERMEHEGAADPVDLGWFLNRSMCFLLFCSTG